jgi:alpha-1,3-glucan synthase
LIRKGLPANPLVYPASDYNNNLLYCTDRSSCSIDNAFAVGADKWRYSFNYGGNWSDWEDYTTTYNTSDAATLTGSWDGVHIMIQYWSALTNSAHSIVHADALYIGSQRRNPSYIVRGKFNKWGLDAGLTMNLENNNDVDGWTLGVSDWLEKDQIHTC